MLDMKKASSITDFFILLSGNSTRQVKAITDYVIEKLRQKGQRVWHVEGYSYALWVLLDCADVVVHIFTPTVRKFYDLERLWADAPMITLKK